MVYNLTNFTATNTTMQYLAAGNDLTGDWWARLFLIGLFLVIAIPLWIRTFQLLQSSVAAGFVTSLVAVLFYGMDLVGYKEPLWSIIVFGSFVVVLLLGGFKE